MRQSPKPGRARRPAISASRGGGRPLRAQVPAGGALRGIDPLVVFQLARDGDPVGRNALGDVARAIGGGAGEDMGKQPVMAQHPPLQHPAQSGARVQGFGQKVAVDHDPRDARPGAFAQHGRPQLDFRHHQRAGARPGDEQPHRPGQIGGHVAVGQAGGAWKQPLAFRQSCGRLMRQQHAVPFGQQRAHQRRDGAGFAKAGGIDPDRPARARGAQAEAVRQVAQVAGFPPGAPGQPQQQQRQKHMRRDLHSQMDQARGHAVRCHGRTGRRLAVSCHPPGSRGRIPGRSGQRSFGRC